MGRGDSCKSITVTYLGTMLTLRLARRIHFRIRFNCWTMLLQYRNGGAFCATQGGDSCPG